MSEKLQHTTAHTREKMLNRYGQEVHHKHDKCHHLYRHHYKSHPCKANHISTEPEINQSTGALREFKLRKVRKRLDKGRIH